MSVFVETGDFKTTTSLYIVLVLHSLYDIKRRTVFPSSHNHPNNNGKTCIATITPNTSANDLLLMSRIDWHSSIGKHPPPRPHAAFSNKAAPVVERFQNHSMICKWSIKNVTAETSKLCSEKFTVMQNLEGTLVLLIENQFLYK